MADKFYIVKVAGDLGPYDIEEREMLAKFPEHTVFEATECKMNRTLLQNKAMHKYFQLLATALNDAGLDMRKVMKPDADIPWNTLTVKEYLWRPIQKVLKNQSSTTDMSTSDPSEIYTVLSRHISQEFGVNVDWPSNK